MGNYIAIYKFYHFQWGIKRYPLKMLHWPWVKSKSNHEQYLEIYFVFYKTLDYVSLKVLTRKTTKARMTFL